MNLIIVLREQALFLDRLAREIRSGGWSSQHLDAIEQQADLLWAAIARYSQMIMTQLELTHDAVTRRYGPGAVVLTVTGQNLYLTSWPWFEDQGTDDETAMIMARTVADDPTTNYAWRYFIIMQRLGSFDLETGEVTVEEDPRG